MTKKKKDMTPAQKAAARKNPDAPKINKAKKAKKPNNLNDPSPFGGIGVTILLLVVILGAVGAFFYMNNFFGILD